MMNLVIGSASVVELDLCCSFCQSPLSLCDLPNFGGLLNIMESVCEFHSFPHHQSSFTVLVASKLRDEVPPSPLSFFSRLYLHLNLKRLEGDHVKLIL